MSMVYIVPFFVCLTALPSVVITQAPGDGDSFCLSILPNVPGVAPPIYPVNARILMDSFNYIRLLSSQTSAAWQQVDVDGIQLQGRGATWFQTADNACRQIVTACGFRDGVQNNWLITQFINRTTVDGTRLPQVSIQVEFEQEGCIEGCSRISSWYGYETSTINSVAARNTSNYVLISRLVPNDGNLQNQTKYLNFANNESGFYLAIRDEDTCIAVIRVLVFYNVCPQETAEFMIRPETLSPPITTPSQEPLRVTGQCVANAGTESGAAPSLICSPGGTWIVVSCCQCNQGFRATENGMSCTEACVAGTYLSMTYGECRNCPGNSVGVAPGLVVCPCVGGYYRAPGEEDLPCTQPPSAVRNIRLKPWTPDSITLIWDSPVNFGGRNDTVYVLFYHEEGSSSHVEAVTVNTTMGTITGLTPGVNYKVFVTAMNGVSLQAMPMTNISGLIIVCAVGKYQSVFYGECRDCPENSVGVLVGLTTCPCVEGYNRALGEDDLPCTQPPSPVRNVQIVSQSPDSVTLMWDPPVNFGGRNDTVYVLSYQEEGNSSRINAVMINITMGTITGLIPGVNYEIFVTSVNGISEAMPVLVSLSTPTESGSTEGPPLSGTAIGVIISMLIVPVLIVIFLVLLAAIIHYKRRINHISEDQHSSSKDQHASSLPEIVSSAYRSSTIEPQEVGENFDLHDNTAYISRKKIEITGGGRDYEVIG